MIPLSNTIVQLTVTKETKDIAMPFRKGETQLSSGSAFFIEKKKPFLLTCNHCVEDAIHINVYIPKYGKRKFDAIVYSRCPLFDIAILEVKDCPKCHDAFPLQKNGIQITKSGDRVEAIGFPLGQDNIKMTRGIVSGHQFNKYQIDSPINPGNSGGPVLRDGKVIGIVNSGFVFSNDIGYAVPIERYFQLKEVMKKNTVVYPPKFFGFFLQENPKMNQEGLYIYNIFKRSCIVNKSVPKLKIGDVLLKLGKHKVQPNGLLDKLWMNNYMEIEDYLYTIPFGGKIPFEVKRGNRQLTGVIPIEVRIKHGEGTRIPIPFCLVGGLVFINAKMENLQQVLTTLSFHDDKKSIEYIDFLTTFESYLNNFLNKNRKMLMVINVLAGSMFSPYFSVFDILDTVNGQPISKLKDLKEIVYDKKPSNLKIKMMNSVSVTLSKSKLEKEKKMIDHKYGIDDFYQL